jgi:hypothetical protein
VQLVSAGSVGVAGCCERKSVLGGDLIASLWLCYKALSPLETLVAKDLSFRLHYKQAVAEAPLTCLARSLLCYDDATRHQLHQAYPTKTSAPSHHHKAQPAVFQYIKRGVAAAQDDFTRHHSLVKRRLQAFLASACPPSRVQRRPPGCQPGTGSE